METVQETSKMGCVTNKVTYNVEVGPTRDVVSTQPIRTLHHQIRLVAQSEGL